MSFCLKNTITADKTQNIGATPKSRIQLKRSLYSMLRQIPIQRQRLEAMMMSFRLKETVKADKSPLTGYRSVSKIADSLHACPLVFVEPNFYSMTMT